MHRRPQLNLGPIRAFEVHVAIPAAADSGKVTQTHKVTVLAATRRDANFYGIAQVRRNLGLAPNQTLFAAALPDTDKKKGA